MIEHLPSWINVLFILTTILTIGLFHFANGKPTKVTLAIVVLALIQSVLSYSGFYNKVGGFPPRFVLLLVPGAIFIILGLRKNAINWLAEHRNRGLSILIHIIRFPVEIVLLHLFIHEMIPEILTFEGRNFDIVAGLTAPIIAVLFMKNKLNIQVLKAWNFICLGLILFIAVNGILSSELPIQQFGFDQPNKGMEYFPFALLPGIVVPIVIHTHISDLMLLFRSKNQ